MGSRRSFSKKILSNLKQEINKKSELSSYGLEEKQMDLSHQQSLEREIDELMAESAYF